MHISKLKWLLMSKSMKKIFVVTYGRADTFGTLGSLIKHITSSALIFIFLVFVSRYTACNNATTMRDIMYSTCNRMTYNT